MKKLIGLLMLASSLAYGATTEQDQVFKNILKNSGFENGKAGYTASGGTFSITGTAADVAEGTFAGSWDASGVQTLTGPAATIPAGLFGQNCEARAMVKGGDTNLTMQVWDGSNVLASQALAVYSAYTLASINFICPSSGTLAVRFSAGADAAVAKIDALYVGKATNLSQVSQAELFGSIKWPGTTNCTWSATGSWGSFGADSDCTTPTGSNLVANATAPGTKIPAITFVSLPPGEYMLVATGMFQKVSGVDGDAGIRFYDGTGGSASNNIYPGGSGDMRVGSVIGRFLYTTAQSNITFQMQANHTGTVSIQDHRSDLDFVISVYRFPTSTQTALSIDNAAGGWSGYHGGDCAWSTGSVTFADPAADSSCTFTERKNDNFGGVTSYVSGSDKLPGIVFTPKKAGKYFVCALFGAVHGTTGSPFYYELSDTDGPTVVMQGMVVTDVGANQNPAQLCGLYEASSVSSKTLRLRGKVASGTGIFQNNTNVDSAVNWSIFPVSFNVPMPIIVNSLVTDSAGQVRSEYAQLNCDAASSISYQSGSWVSSVGNRSGGACTVTLKSGIFSEGPICTITKKSGSAEASVVQVNSTTSLTITLASSADWVGMIHCMGPR